MFFRKILFVILLSSCSYPALAGIIEDSTCLKEMKTYYPLLRSGQLHWEKQERFFRCVHDSLELIVVNKIFTHDPARDYFTKAEIFKMFHVHFKLEDSLSQDLVNNLFLIKHFIVGGEMNQLSDKELKNIYELVDVYRDFYYIIHKRIGTINKILQLENRNEVLEEEFQFTLLKLEEGFRFLEKSYQEKNITYKLGDFNHLFSYLEEYNQNAPDWKKYSQFLKLWIQGLLSSKTHIEGKVWNNFLSSFHQIISMFLHYKRYIVESNVSRPEIVSRGLKNLEYFVSALSFVESSQEKKGFPINNVDKMLSMMISLSKDQFQPFGDWPVLETEKKNPIPLFTRSLVCFVFKKNQSKNCSYKVGGGNFLSLEYHFPDGIFQFYQDRQKWLPQKETTFEVLPSQLKSIKKWLSDYNEGYERLFQGQSERVSKLYKFDHWLESSFGETETDSRIIFYPLSSPSTFNKLPYRLLNYRLLSDLFLSRYKEDKWGYKLSFRNWKNVVDEVLPVLLSFESEGYDFSLRSQLIGLFDYADRFLNSSNGDQSLNEVEILDLIVHVMSAIENSKYAYNKIIHSCSNALKASCVGTKIFEKDIMQPFPRLQSYLLNDNLNMYRLGTQKLLEDRSPLEKSSDLIDVFLILQMLEVNFQLNDKNGNIRLDNQEIFQIVKKISDRLVHSIPHIKDLSQSQSFIMYSFKTGRIPFLKEDGESFHSLKFLNWYMNRKNEMFDISKDEFYSTTLKFYRLYRDYL